MFALWDQWQEGTMFGSLSQLSHLWDLDKQEQKGVGDELKSSIGVAMQAAKGGLFLQEEGGEGFSLCTALL